MRQVPEAIVAKALIAHEAIHDQSQAYVLIGDKTYPIIKYRNGCRCVRLDEYVVIEQNKLKNTDFAKRALAGEKISWIIPDDPGTAWMLLDASKTNA